MRKLPPVDVAAPEARAAWAADVRALVGAVRPLLFDALAPKGERVHSRRYLRRVLSRRMRDLDAHINAIDAAAPHDAREPALATPPGAPVSAAAPDSCDSEPPSRPAIPPPPAT